MSRTLIAITDSPFPSLDPAKKALARLDPEYRMAKSPSADDILAVARDADAVLVTYAKLPGELLRQLKTCKAIGRFGLGVDNIDLDAATHRGVVVMNTPGGNSASVAEISRSAVSIRAGSRSSLRLVAPTMSTLAGTTVGFFICHSLGR